MDELPVLKFQSPKRKREALSFSSKKSHLSNIYGSYKLFPRPDNAANHEFSSMSNGEFLCFDTGSSDGYDICSKNLNESVATTVSGVSNTSLEISKSSEGDSLNDSSHFSEGFTPNSPLWFSKDSSNSGSSGDFTSRIRNRVLQSYDMRTSTSTTTSGSLVDSDSDSDLDMEDYESKGFRSINNGLRLRFTPIEHHSKLDNTDTEEPSKVTDQLSVLSVDSRIQNRLFDDSLRSSFSFRSPSTTNSSLCFSQSGFSQVPSTPYFSPSAISTSNILRCAMGDLGTPVSEAGSPAVIDVEGSDLEAALAKESPFLNRSRDNVIVSMDEEDDALDSSINRLVENSLSKYSSSPDSLNRSSFSESILDCSNSFEILSNVSMEDSLALNPAKSLLVDVEEDQKSTSSFLPKSFIKSCPFTPHRPDRIENLPARLSLPKLTRQNSLNITKLLLSQSESPHPDNIDYLENFECDILLGSGAFGNVYRMKDKKDGKYYALKKSRKQFRSRRDRDWLLNEVRIMKILGVEPCDYIIHLVKAWQADGYFYVQTDMAEKGSLKDLLQAHPKLPNFSIWHIIHDVSCGLAHIHKCELVHLDIKPANLLIGEDNKIRIGDFGMAVSCGRGDDDGHEGDNR